MKLKCSRSELLNGFGMVSRAISTKSILPILSGVNVKADDIVELVATDLEMSIITSISSNVMEKGSSVLPARLTIDILKSLPEAAVNLETDEENGSARITCSNSKFNIKVLSPKDFPAIPEIKSEKKIVLKQTAFNEAAHQVVRAASSDESRPILTGILFSLKDSVLDMVATDSYRLARGSTRIMGDGEFDVIIPAKAIAEVGRTQPKGEDEELEIVVEENQVKFKCVGYTLTSRLIAGSYPPYKQLIPTTFATNVEINKTEFEEVVRRVKTVAVNNVPIKLTITSNSTVLSANSKEVGEAVEDIKVKTEGSDIEIAFNPDYLLDGVSGIKGERLLLRLDTPLKSGLLRPVDNDDFIYLLMPVRVG
ncbi:MAG: DNA polymerase III subunit beta [Actinobacteria bacterium]|nr:DNA polymerase III subunit beta [Actinomycetota bacterium]